MYGGEACPSTPVTRDCTPTTDCVWTWSEWSSCSANPPYRKTRTATITQQPAETVQPVPTPPEYEACDPADCDGAWSTWSDCDRDTSTQSRQWATSKEPMYGGEACPSTPKHGIAHHQRRTVSGPGPSGPPAPPTRPTAKRELLPSHSSRAETVQPARPRPSTKPAIPSPATEHGRHGAPAQTPCRLEHFQSRGPHRTVVPPAPILTQRLRRARAK